MDQPQVLRRLQSLQESVGVTHRNLVLPVEDYANLTGFGVANDTWIRCATDLGENAVRKALDQVAVRAGEQRAVGDRLVVVAALQGVSTTSR